MKFHPHLHILTDSGINFNQKFNKIWRKTILNNLNIKSNKYFYGYYVWSEKRDLNSKQVARYTARYVRHPAIANGRIIKYSKHKVTFFYKDNHNKNVLITKSITDFISSLIQHIPLRQFKMIRHYDVYGRNKKKTVR